jgi:uncharacterized membrane protein
MAIANQLPAGELIRFGWTTTLRNLLLFLAVMLVEFAIDLALTRLSVLAEGNGALPVAALGLASLVLRSAVALGLARIALAFCDGRRGRLADLLAEFQHILPYLLAQLLFSAIVTLGLILLIVPGIYLALRLQFFKYFIVDFGAGPLEALARSWDATRGAAWDLLGLWGWLFLVNLAGALALGVGLLITVPLTIVAMAAAYRTLAARAMWRASVSGPQEQLDYL